MTAVNSKPTRTKHSRLIGASIVIIVSFCNAFVLMQFIYIAGA